MLYISSNNPKDQLQLQQQYPVSGYDNGQDRTFAVSLSDNITSNNNLIYDIFDGIVFQIFGQILTHPNSTNFIYTNPNNIAHNNSNTYMKQTNKLINKLISLMKGMFKSQLSLNLLRQILQIIKMQAIKLRLYQEYILRINQEFMQGDDDEGDGYCQQEYDGDGVEGGQGFGQLKGWNDKDKKSKKDKQQDQTEMLLDKQKKLENQFIMEINRGLNSYVGQVYTDHFNENTPPSRLHIQQYQQTFPPQNNNPTYTNNNNSNKNVSLTFTLTQPIPQPQTQQPHPNSLPISKQNLSKIYNIQQYQYQQLETYSSKCLQNQMNQYQVCNIISVSTQLAVLRNKQSQVMRREQQREDICKYCIYWQFQYHYNPKIQYQNQQDHCFELTLTKHFDVKQQTNISNYTNSTIKNSSQNTTSTSTPYAPPCQTEFLSPKTHPKIRSFLLEPEQTLTELILEQKIQDIKKSKIITKSIRETQQKINGNVNKVYRDNFRNIKFRNKLLGRNSNTNVNVKRQLGAGDMGDGGGELGQSRSRVINNQQQYNQIPKQRHIQHRYKSERIYTTYKNPIDLQNVQQYQQNKQNEKQTNTKSNANTDMKIFNKQKNINKSQMKAFKFFKAKLF